MNIKQEKGSSRALHEPAAERPALLPRPRGLHRCLGQRVLANHRPTRAGGAGDGGGNGELLLLLLLLLRLLRPPRPAGLRRQPVREGVASEPAHEPAADPDAVRQPRPEPAAAEL